MTHENERRLDVGELVQEGDIMCYGARSVVVGRCNYGWGCRAGHMVAPGDRYYRRAEQDNTTRRSTEEPQQVEFRWSSEDEGE